MAKFFPSSSGGGGGGAAAVALYEAVVHATDGDYATVGEALADGATRIFVRDGTYAESAISDASNNIHIRGESTAAIISIGANNFTLSGTNVVIEGVKFLSTTGAIAISGADSQFLNNEVESSGTTNVILTINGTRALIQGNNINDTSVAVITGASARVVALGSHARIVNNYIKVRYGTAAACNMYGNHSLVNSNTFVYHTAVGTKTLANIGGNWSEFSGNMVIGSGASDYMVGVNGACAVSANYIYNGLRGIYCFGGAGTTISANSYYSSTANVIGIYLDNSGQTVSGNNLFGGVGASSVGIHIGNSCDNNTISGNTISDFNDGVKINAASCDNNAILGNNFIGNTLTKAINDAGTNTRMVGNTGVRLDATMNKDYRYMKNTSGGALAAGDVVILKAVANSDEVTTTTTGGDNKVFGIAVGAIANNAYGDIQILGKTTLLKVDGTTDIAIGDFLSTYTAAGIAAKATAGQTAFAIALEAYATDDSAGVIDALLITPRLI